MLNVKGYKMIFFVENLLREYITEFSVESDINQNTLDEAMETARGNGLVSPLVYSDLLKYLHITQLLDIIKSLSRKKRNKVSSISYTYLREQRNNIMHSRLIGYEEIEKIQQYCNNIVEALLDNKFKTKWEQFITIDIEEFEVPLVFLEYPWAKNFDNLIGRDKELRDLKEELKLPIPVSVVGIGGLGKTALVLQLIEDLMYSPERPFDRIYFMSFKNTMYENGEIKRFDKIISNHDDLIIKLASLMDINIDKDLVEVKESVWNNIFSTNSLLILDNLETEVVQSNLAEFSDIAHRFMKKHFSSSRLIITSRYGLGERDNPYPLTRFILEGTKQFFNFFMKDQESKLKTLSDSDWEWIQKVSFGNPGRIISLCNTFRSSPKSIQEIRIDFETNYLTPTSQKIDEESQEFIRFCFENTIDSMPLESQKYLSILCYLCLETNIYQINEELLSFIKEELKLPQIYGEKLLRSQLLVNIGFCQRVSDSSYYSVNELIVDYLNGNYSEKTFNVFSLKKEKLFNELYEITELFNEIQFDKELPLPVLLSSIYKSKFRVTKDIRLLIKAYQCDPTLETLISIFEKITSQEIYKNYMLIEKLSSRELNDARFSERQQYLACLIFNAFTKIKKELMYNRNAKGRSSSIRSNDLFKAFQALEKKIGPVKNKMLETKTRISICNYLIAAKELNLAEQYLVEDEFMQTTKCEIFVNQIGELAGSDRVKCETYITKSQFFNWSKINNKRLYRKFLISSARYYRNNDHELCLSQVNKYLQNSPSLPTSSDMSAYSFYLEAKLLKAQCIYALKGTTSEVIEIINEFKAQMGTPTYRELLYRKKEDFEKSLEILELNIKKAV